MTSPSPVDNQSQDQAAVIEPDFAADFHKFWEKNHQLVYLVCGAILLVVAAYLGWEKYQVARDESTRAAYAAAGTAPEKLSAFASANPDHVLAAVAILQVADAKYTAGDFSAAATQYQQAVAKLTNPILKSRARLGVAVCKLSSGDQSGAEADLKALTADSSLEKQIRAEATYHLATLINTPGRTDEVRQLLAEVSKIDDSGIWSQRASQLNASLLAEGLAKP
jgi:predicted negative regulator of RcsB-dependent stress response